jgi:hypothetical protein
MAYSPLIGPLHWLLEPQWDTFDAGINLLTDYRQTPDGLMS